MQTRHLYFVVGDSPLVTSKCFNLLQTCRLLFSGQWAMPIREWFILLSKFFSKAWSNQWIGSQIRSNDLFSSLPHALSHLKRFSLRAITESLSTSRALNAVARDLFQEECLCLETINIYIYIYIYIYIPQYLRLFIFIFNIGYICLHFAEQTEEDPSMCICFIMFRCSVAATWGVFTLLHIRGQRYTYIHI